MLARRRWIGLLVLWCGWWALGGAGPCWAAATGADAYQEGQRLLAAGDLTAALKSYVAAVKADRQNQQYLQQYLLVRRAIALQAALEKEQDPAKWAQMAQALRVFYASEDLYTLALPLDEELFRRQGTADAAVQLADTLLVLQRPEQAARVLQKLPADKTTTASQAMLGIALARQSKPEEARQLAATVRVAGQADPLSLYLVARLRAAVGDMDDALTLLRRCYEAVPPSRLGVLKARTRTCPEFTAFVSLPAFAAVQQTESKVPESKCSGGSSCSSCPMRGNCGSTNR